MPTLSAPTTMTGSLALDNPIWSALTTGHRDVARINGLAARYPSEVSPLSGLREPTPQAFADLRGLVSDDEVVALFTTDPLDVPEDWEVLRAMFIDQMVCREIATAVPSQPMQLSDVDVPEMMALTAATEPGPFEARTIEMGRYYGVRSNSGELVAMAGQRLNGGDFREVSAVCTDPKFRGNGYAQSLVTFLSHQIQMEGKLPILHVMQDNVAKVVYEKVGFRVRCPIQLTVLKPR